MRFRLGRASGSREAIISYPPVWLQTTKRLQREPVDASPIISLAWRRTGNIKEIARERVEILFDLARKIFPKDRTLSKRYLELARLIGMKAGVRLSKEQKLSICKKCGSFLVPGVNCRVRTRPELGTIVLITCLECGAKKRYPTVRERLSKRNN
jgi:ribonuclease P protein subunit RPR2